MVEARVEGYDSFENRSVYSSGSRMLLFKTIRPALPVSARAK